jgi:phosphatidate cytidylyltransferase
MMPAARRPPSGRARRSAAPPPRRRPPERREARQPRQPRERRQRSDLFSRILVAIPAAIVAIVFIDLGGLAFALLMIAAGIACMNELFRLLERWKPVSLVGFAALIGMVLAARYAGLKDVVEVAVGAVPVLFVAVLMRARRGGATVAIAGTLLGVFWIGFAFAHAELLRELPHGKNIVLDVAVGTFLGDTAAYLGGRLFGRRPLAPEISPSKTVEGLFCGMLIAILAVFVAGLFQKTWMTQGDALLLGIAVAVLGPLGDLFESLVKRDAGAKDAGSLFGAHGGALDRLDGVMFTIVAGYYIWLGVMH